MLLLAAAPYGWLRAEANQPGNSKAIMDIVIKELLTLYNAFVLGAPDPLSPLRIQYKDYAAWQQQQLQGANLPATQGLLAAAVCRRTTGIELPADQARPPVKTYNGAAVSTSIDEFITAGIRQLSQEQGSALFMGLVAAVNVLLHRYTGQEDIIIGTPVAGRSHIDLENQIGFYTNTLALRFRLGSCYTYQEVLREVQQVILGAYEHQAYPLDELVEALHLQRDRSRHPLFETEVVLQHAQSASEKASPCMVCR